MPIPWLTLPAESLPVQAPAKQSIQLVDGVEISYAKSSVDLKTLVYTLSEGVTVKYDQTTVHADSVMIDQAKKHGYASGHVHVIDPVGTIDADNIEIWWSKEDSHSFVNHADIRVGTAHIRAASADIRPGVWVVNDARGTTSRANPAWYEVGTKKLTLYPGRSGKLKRPSLSILGQKLLTFPDRSFNLDPRSEGLGIPSFTYRRGEGIGPSWAGGILVNRSTDFAFAAGAFPNTRPNFGFSITHSYVSEDKPQTFLTPSSDFGERFSEGYLESIHVTSPGEEDRNLRYFKRSIAFDSTWNIGATGRGAGEAYSKAGEVIYETAEPVGKFSFGSQTRVQSIRQLDQAFESRVIESDTLGFPSVQFGRNIRSIARLDTTNFFGPKQYGWVRGIVGLAFEPMKQLRFSAGAYSSFDYGTPDYIIDPLVSKTGLVYRADFNLGPTKFSYMTKYDTRLGWFDREYSVSQVVGCFEPFLLYRKYPNEYALGLRLNLDDLMNLVTSRNFSRPNPVPKVISPDKDGRP